MSSTTEDVCRVYSLKVGKGIILTPAQRKSLDSTLELRNKAIGT